MSIKVWMLKNPFFTDVDYGGISLSLRPIFKFSNYRNFSLFDRLKYRSKFKFRELLEDKRESFLLKAQINNDIMNNDDDQNLSKFLTFDEHIYYNRWYRRKVVNSNFKKKDLLPLLSEFNAIDESEDNEVEDNEVEDNEDEFEDNGGWFWDDDKYWDDEEGFEPEREDLDLPSKFDFDPSMVYFFFSRKRFLKFLKLPERFLYEEKDSFLKLIGSNITSESQIDSIFFLWFNKFYKGLFSKRIYFFKTLKKNIFYFRRKHLRHSLNMFFYNLNQIFDVKNLFRLFFFSLYNLAFFRVNPRVVIPIHRRFYRWSVQRRDIFINGKLKFAFRKYRVIEHKFGSFVNFIYENLIII